MRIFSSTFSPRLYLIIYAIVISADRFSSRNQEEDIESSLRGIRDPHGDPLSIPGLSRVLSLREAAKRARYRPILGDLVDDPQHLAIFLVEATGRLSDPAMDLVKFIVKDSPSRAILNTFCSQIGGSIARYNAMATHAWGSDSSHSSVGEVAG